MKIVHNGLKTLLLLATASMSDALANTVTTQGLLEEMVDKKSISYYPATHYTQKQFSSYDRASDKADKKHFTWFANHDWSHFLRVEEVDGRTEHVMFDAKGPGCVTRFWMTVAGNHMTEGTLRFYIDGQKQPVLEGNALELIGSNKLFAYPLSAAVSELSPHANRGHNLYMPIPYAQSCKITYENKAFGKERIGGNFYYNINYRSYQPDTKVESFTKETPHQLQDFIKSTNSALLAQDSFQRELKHDINLAPEKEESLTFSERDSAIAGITLSVDAKDVPQALRSTIISMSFDGQNTVWVPIGDFFTAGYHLNETKTWRTRINPATKMMSCNWVMPYQEECRISFINLGDQDVRIKAAVATTPYQWDKERSMYFGASWFQLSGISTGEGARNMNGDFNKPQDINFVTLQGKGVYVGDALTVYNTAPAGNMAWWGEGDEKVYVDGESFPSHFGTGSEDYYGYAWCRAERFNHPFIAQPAGEGNLTPGYTVNSRFRALDAIPFTKSLQFDMELWHWTGVKVNYAPVTFYYIFAGTKSNIQPDIKAAQHPVARSIENVVSK